MNLNELSRAASLAEQLEDVCTAIDALPDTAVILGECAEEPFCLQLMFRTNDGVTGVGVPIPSHLRSTYAGNLRAFLEDRRREIVASLSDLGVTVLAAVPAAEADE